MLFNSVQFIFVFLPIVLTGFFFLGALRLYYAAIAWAFLASLVFYGWDDPWRLLPLVLASATFNYFLGRALARYHSRWLLFIGVAANILLLSYFKYTAFLLENFGHLTGLTVPRPEIRLPIGISFYTFTQIAFLVDAYRKEAHEYEPLKYGLFVTYFPHLIAGPILHHKEIVPQFNNPDTYRLRLMSLAHGLAWFTAGLFKKVILADSISMFVQAPFGTATAGLPPTFGDAWIGTLSYTLQIYFDFSGYTDMAIGLALMMGITFPLNFNSPYKAHSLIDFWRRWHMTLSRFLRDYLYIPLGGNRKGPARRYANLLITMVLGGLWHGASWNFAVWGAIHGTGLLFNHLWRENSDRLEFRLPPAFGWAVTFLLVVFAWVPFRAETLGSSLLLWKSMLGLHGLAAPTVSNVGEVTAWIVVLLAIALFSPNTQEFLSLGCRAPSSIFLRWRANARWAIMLGCLFGIAIAGMIGKSTTFLYFRF
jgi:alginate O-acetyltransferase complex protein AlgI